MVLGIESAMDRNQLSAGSSVRFRALPNATGGLSAFPKHGDAREKMGSNSALWVGAPRRGAVRDAIPLLLTTDLKGSQMLILTRNEEQSVTVDGPCIVKVLGIQGNRVKLGFIAKDSTKIVRTELIDMKLLEMVTQ